MNTDSNNILRSNDPKERKTELSKLYLRYRDEFVQWATNANKIDMEVACDIYQDAIVILYEKITSGEQISVQTKTYLFGIGKKLIARVFEKQDIVSRHQQKVGEHIGFLLGESETSNPEQQKLLTILKLKLDELGEPCSSILSLYYYEQYSLKEIGTTLNYSDSNVVKTQKSRCLKKLRSYLKSN